MEILFITHKYPPGTGGMEKQSFELISRMKSFAKVHVIAIASKESKFNFFWTLKSKIKNHLSQNPEISVVHFNDGVMALFGLFLYQWKGIKKTATFHGLDITFPNLLFRKFLVPKFHKLDHIICVSRYTAKVCQKLGFADDKISIIHNGIDHELAMHQPHHKAYKECNDNIGDLILDKKILLSIGRAVRRKGFSWFMKEVLPGLPDDFHYVIIGPTQKRSIFHKMIYSILPQTIKTQIDLFLGWADDSSTISILLRQPSIQERATHLGKIPFDQLVVLLEKCHALVMPNIEISGDAEGFGLVALEANMKNKLVFASNLQGIQDAVHHNENGILIEAENVDQWVNTIIDTTINKEVEEKALQFALNRFSWNKMVSEYHQLFEKLELQKNELQTEVISIS